MGFNIDADLSNADWTKRTWDLTGIDSLDKLQAYLKVHGMTAAQFKKLPVYKFNVDNPDMAWLKSL